MIRHMIVLFSIAGMIACWGSVVTAQGVHKKNGSTYLVDQMMNG
jgi:hypothetical protein